LAKAQDEQDFANKKQADIEALKVAFISKELALTPQEAQQFWPVYNQYSNELAATKIDNPDVLERDEKVLNLRKSYRDRFTKILGPQRVNNMYNAEGRFRQLLFKAMRKQNQLQNRPNRPFRRNF
jgi:CRISPR/Cas system-associated endonuclease Cas1